MVDDKFSCIKEKTKNVPIALSTAYQGNEITGISNVLDSWKRQYIQQLQGIVVSYKNVSLVSKFAYIKSDCPIIHCNVRATFELFVPMVGSIVRGKVNRISHDYIGCLVHNTINVAIHRNQNEYEDFRFIALDKEILFEITHLGFKRKIIRVKGKITEECFNLMKELQMLNGETDAASRIMLTTPPISSNEEITNEEHEDNYESDGENQSQSLLCNNASLFVNSASDLNYSFSVKRKKKSGLLQTELSSTGQSKSSDTEHEEESENLSHNDTESVVKDSDEVNSDLQNGNKKKSNKLLTKSSTKRPYESLDFENEDQSQSLLFNSIESNSQNSFEMNSDLPKKKKKKSNKKSRHELTTKLLFESPDYKRNSLDPIDYNLVKEEITTDSSSNSHKKKKSKSSKNNSLEKNLIMNSVMEGSSTDTSSHLSSSPKKKHKKPKTHALNSPPLFSDSLSSSQKDNSIFKMPKSPKKKHKTVQEKVSSVEMTTHYEDSSSLLLSEDKIPSNSLATSVSPTKASIKSEKYSEDYNLMELTSILESKLLSDNVKDEPSISSKRNKKRKHESSDKEGLPKKKRKIGENESISVKTGSKSKSDKLKKRSKEKSKKGSKKDKKSKKKVISSKKKLPKLKKKKKEKNDKKKKKKSKKPSKDE